MSRERKSISAENVKGKRDKIRNGDLDGQMKKGNTV